MTVMIAVGTRPEIVKMAPIVRACLRAHTPFVIAHTGQHYSPELDAVFFDDLALPQPDVRLAVGSGTHAYQISTVLARLEPFLLEHRPDVVLVEGDTNSVLGVALAARTAGIAVGHVEAGLRSRDRAMPEEMNRILVDHLADVCFAPTEAAAGNLRAEGIEPARIVVTGNTVVDEVLHQRDRADARGTRKLLGIAGQRYAAATVHRAENTNDPRRLRAIMDGLAAVGRDLRLPVLATFHPRTVRRLDELGIPVEPVVRVLPPLGYLEFLDLQAGAALVLTDSGGVQEEACTLGVPCVTLRDSTERPESIEVGANVLAGADADRIVELARLMLGRRATWLNPFGDGQSGPRIVSWLADGGLLRLEPAGSASTDFALPPVDSALVPGPTLV